MHEHPEVLTVEAWRPYVEAGPVTGSLLTKCLFLKDKKSRNYLVFALADTECDLKHLTKEVKILFPVCVILIYNVYMPSWAFLFYIDCFLPCICRITQAFKR